MNKLNCGDCLDVFKNIPDNMFDVSFADPPFNLDKKYLNYDDSVNEAAYLDWCFEWISEMVRVTKPSGSILIHNIPKWLIKFCCMLDEMDCHFKHWIAWDAPTTPMGKSLQPAHYGVLYYTKSEESKFHELRMPHKRCRGKQCSLLLKDYGGKKHTIHPFGPLVSDVWTDIHRRKHTPISQKVHPCSLPLHLMERLILMCTDEGDSVFDCFAGTGTSLVAAKRLGREYSGIELSREYVEHCEERLKESLESKVDDIWVSCYIRKIFTVRDCDIMQNKKWRDQWISLFENWPDTDEQRRGLNTADLIFRPDIRKKIQLLSKSA